MFNNDYNTIRSIFDEYERPTVSYREYVNNLWNNGEEVLKYLREERGFNDETIKRFKIGMNENGDIAIPVFKDNSLIDFKFRSIKEKKFYRIQGAQTWVVNEDAITSARESKKIMIVEGEMDAMAISQLGIKSVISPTGGAHNKKMEWLELISDEIEDVYICMDNDEIGQEAARDIAERIGLEKCFNIVLPTKDANDFLKEGYTLKDLVKIINEAKRFDIRGVVKVGSILDELQGKKIERISTPINRLNEQMKGGIPRKSMVIFSGHSGIGKSTTLLNFLVHHANEGKPCLLISLENDIYYTFQRVLELKYNKKFEDFTEEEFKTIKAELVDYPLYVDMSMETYTMDKIQTMATQAKKLYGIEFLGFDHIGFLPNRKYNVVQEISQMSRDFKMLAVNKDIIVYLVSHIRRLDDIKTRPTGDDIKDSSSLVQDCDCLFFIHGTDNGDYIIIDKSRMSRSKLDIPIIIDREKGIVYDDNERDILVNGMLTNETEERSITINTEKDTGI